MFLNDDWRVAKGSKSNAVKNAAKLMGSRGGKARAKVLSPEERRAIAKKAIAARWSGAKKSNKKPTP